MDSDSDSDDDDDDEDADNVAPYDPAKQARPKLPIILDFKPQKSCPMRYCKLWSHFSKLQEKIGYRDMEIDSLWIAVVKAKKPPGEPVVRIAITGDTGTGNSATLNSLLGVQSNSGGMCITLSFGVDWFLY